MSDFKQEVIKGIRLYAMVETIQQYSLWSFNLILILKPEEPLEGKGTGNEDQDDTDVQNRLLDSVGEGEGGML